MGASESLLAIRGNSLTATIPGVLPGLEGLFHLDVYQIVATGGSYEVLNSSGVIVYYVEFIPACCATDLNREVFLVRDSQKRVVLSVFTCGAGSDYNSPSSQPGVLIVYVKATYCRKVVTTKLVNLVIAIPEV